MNNEILFIAAAIALPPLVALVLSYLPKAHALGVALLMLSLTFVEDINFFAELSYRGITRSMDFTSTDLVVWGLLLFLLVERRRRGGAWMSPARVGPVSPVVWYPSLTTAFVLYLAINAISLMGAGSAKFAAFDMVKIARGFLLFWVAANMIRDDETAKALPACFAAFVLVETGVVVWDHYTGIWQARATFEHKNLFAFSMNMVLPFLFARALIQKRRSLPYLALFLGGAVAVILSRSRTAWGTMVLAGGIVVALSFLATWKRRADGRISRMVVILGAMLVAAIPLGAKLADGVIERWGDSAEASMDFRAINNRIALELASENLLGVGPNNYVKKLDDRIAEDLNPVDRIVAHNAYLLVAAELGWVGLAVFVAMLLSFAHLAWRTYRKSQSLAGLYVSVGAFAAIVASMVHGLMESHGFFDRHSYFVWCLMMGVTIGAAQREGVARLSFIRWLLRRRNQRLQLRMRSATGKPMLPRRRRGVTRPA